MDFIIVYSMLYCSTSLFLINVHMVLYLISSPATGRTQLYYFCEVSLEIIIIIIKKSIIFYTTSRA